MQKDKEKRISYKLNFATDSINLYERLQKQKTRHKKGHKVFILK